MVYLENEEGDTALDIAAHNQNIELSKILLNYGSTPKSRHSISLKRQARNFRNYKLYELLDSWEKKCIEGLYLKIYNEFYGTTDILKTGNIWVGPDDYVVVQERNRCGKTLYICKRNVNWIEEVNYREQDIHLCDPCKVVYCWDNNIFTIIEYGYLDCDGVFSIEGTTKFIGIIKIKGDNITRYINRNNITRYELKNPKFVIYRKIMLTIKNNIVSYTQWIADFVDKNEYKVIYKMYPIL